MDFLKEKTAMIFRYVLFCFGGCVNLLKFLNTF